jgi:hypothetical protein
LINRLNLSTAWTAACFMLFAIICHGATLVRDGQAAAVVGLPTDPTDVEALAAEELIVHIRKMSGVALELREVAPGRSSEFVAACATAKKLPVLLGRAVTDGAQKKAQVFSDRDGTLRLQVLEDRIHISGRGEGMLFGVYELLEQLDVRWFMPGEIGTVIPASKTVAIGQQDTIQQAGFAGRILGISDPMMTEEQQQSSMTWFRRMRMGGFSAGSHGLSIEADAETEPDLFMTVNGQQVGKLKVSHPEVLRRTVESCLARLAKNPDLAFVNVGPGDGLGFGHDSWDAGDVDPLHGKISVTDRYIKFFNLVLAELHKVYPDVGLAFYCYSQHMRPPVREKPHPKILPVLAPIDVCRFHAINNPLCWERQYIRKIVNGWKALGVEIVYRGYLFNLADQGLPFSMIRQIREEFPYYHREQVIACRVECKPAWAYHGPSLYLASKIMWNPEVDVDALLEDYFSKLYGPAAAPMHAHFERLERAYQQADYHTGNVFDIPHILTADVMAELEETLHQAEQLATGNAVIAKRVEMTRVGYDFGRASLKMMASLNAFDFVEAKRQLDKIQGNLVPKALTHDPPILNVRYGGDFTERFWAQTVEQGYERTATNGNEIVAKLPDEWLFMMDPFDGGEALGLWKPDVGTQSWRPLKTYSQSWSNQGMRYYKGEAWYRTRALVPVQYAGRKIFLWLGGIDDTASAWINGRELAVLNEGWPPCGRPWEFEATDAIRPGEENVVVVKVSNRQVDEIGTGGMTGPAMIWAGGPGN